MQRVDSQWHYMGEEDGHLNVMGSDRGQDKGKKWTETLLSEEWI